MRGGSPAPARGLIAPKKRRRRSCGVSWVGLAFPGVRLVTRTGCHQGLGFNPKTLNQVF
jgi:hypothetical protein